MIHQVRRGSGSPLVLVPGLGSTWRSWEPVLDALALQREVIAIDLPGFGASAPLTGEVTIARLADALEAFLAREDLATAGVAGSSLGARLVLELARRGHRGDVVALDPGGFWTDAQRRVFGASLKASIVAVRALQRPMPALMAHPVGRTVLLAQLSPRPWALPADLALREIRGWAQAPGFDATLRALVDGPPQEGAFAGGTAARVTIGWGRKDRVTLPSQAATAQARFPDARLHWFEHSGHFPHWDEPTEAADVILAATA